MTACVNKKSKRVAAVVTASLVGALSIGAPAVALAANNTSIDLLVAGDVEDIAKGEITAYTDQDGDAVDSAEFVANGSAQYLIPTELVTKTGKKIDIAKSDLAINYYEYDKDQNSGTWLSDGTKVNNVSKSEIKAAGTYYVGVGAKGATASKLAFVKFTIANKSLQGAKIIDGNDKNDTTIEYVAHKMNLTTDLNVCLDGTILTKETDYSIQLFEKGSLGNTGNVDVENVGDYVARVTGKNNYAGSTVDIEFSVVPVDLSKASFEIANLNAIAGTEIPGSVTKVDGSSDLAGEVKLVYTGAGLPSTGKGVYTFDVVSTEKDDKDILGTGKVSVVRYEKAAEFLYDGAKVAAGSELDLTKQSLDSAKAFDLSKVKVMGGENALEFDVAYTKENGEAVSAEQTKLPGTYFAVITAKDSTCAFGGSVKVKFSIAAKQINVSDIYVSYKGKVVTSISDIYSGKNLLDSVEVKAYDADGKLVPSTEYDVKVVVKDTENEVSEVVNKGSYTLSVESKKDSMYVVSGTDNKVEITVDAVNITGNADVQDAGAVKLFKGNDVVTAYAYTGEAITPSFEYDLKTGEYKDSKDWIALPSTAYKAKYTMVQDASGETVNKKVDAMVEPGVYNIELIDAAKDANFVVSTTVKNVKVMKASSFKDVDVTEWYARALNAAKGNGYVAGIGSTDMFAPERNITRADAVVILFRTAGGQDVYPDFKYDENQSYDTGFADVNGNAYYANALAWAKSMGIANGSNGKFRPDDNITREEFAALLCNFADAMGADVTVDANAVLSGVADGSKVSAWAKNAVAWAVDNKIMGNGGSVNPLNDIIRAEVAAMVVNYNPGKLA